MGWGQSKPYISESEISDDDLDERYFITPENSRKLADMNSTDTLGSNRLDAVVRTPLPHLSINKIQAIEDQLDDFEIVALLYLLYEDSKLGLQDIEKFIKSGQNEGFLLKWAQHEKTEESRWQNKLLEALCIIQNYQVLKTYGYNKFELQNQYLPFQVGTSCAVKKLRKVLYLIAEKLTHDQTVEFINYMKKALSGSSIPFNDYGHNYLELYFLYWEHSNVNIKHIQQVLKSMNLDQFYDYINYILPSENIPVSSNNDRLLKSVGIGAKKAEDDERKTTTKDNTYLQSGLFEDASFTQVVLPGSSQENSILHSNRYPINPNNPGIVLIINQELFYTEPNIIYQDLLPNNDNMLLPDREGTAMDKDRLEKLFTRMKFKVIIRENLPHFNMINEIEKVTDSVSDESSLIICILSHGDNGVVFGANSCKVKVNNIQKIMCRRNKKLVGKPKVLILQSCQGERCQKIEEEETMDDDEENATDGIAGTKVPATADLLTFWATIPGYAAVRNKKTGSWFIQALCDEIEQGNKKYHFLEICTNIVKKVTSREWKEESGINIMVPMVVLTLTKSFFLPSIS